MKKAALSVVLALLLSALASCAAGTGNKVELTVGELATGSRTYTYAEQEVEREYFYYIPSTYRSGDKLPLMLTLHGSGSNARGQLYESDMKDLAEQEGFIIVAPNAVAIHGDGTLSSCGNTMSAIGRSDSSYLRWNAGPDDPQNAYGVDDVQYLCDLIDQFVDDGYADPGRVYSTGLSHGAFMSVRLALDAPEKIAGIGAVSGLLMDRLAASRPEEQVKLVFVHGTADPVVPIEGQRYDTNGDGLIDFCFSRSLDDTIDWFARRYELSVADVVKTSLPDADPEDGCTIDRYEYQDSKGGVPFVKYVVNGGGHTWPGGSQYLSAAYIGALCKDASASELIWDELKDVSK